MADREKKASRKEEHLDVEKEYLSQIEESLKFATRKKNDLLIKQRDQMDKQNKMTMDKKLEDKRAMKEQDRRAERAQLKYFPYTGGDAYADRAEGWKKTMGIREQYQQVREKGTQETLAKAEARNNMDLTSNPDLFNSDYKAL